MILMVNIYIILTPAVITPIKSPAITPITFSLNDTDGIYIYIYNINFYNVKAHYLLVLTLINMFNLDSLDKNLLSINGILLSP